MDYFLNLIQLSPQLDLINVVLKPHNFDINCKQVK